MLYNIEMKIIPFVFLIVFLFHSGNFAIAKTILKGKISYTVSDARKLAFENVSKKIDINQYKEYFIDPNFEENQLLLSKNKYRAKNRYLTKFSNNNYAVEYTKKKVPNIFYYSNLGQLVLIEFDINKFYPLHSIRYDKNGNLHSLAIDISSSESFIFNADGSLNGHWIKSMRYNEKGELTMTRD